MRIESFTEFKTGQLVPITTESGKQQWAFVPNPLPSTWRMSEKLWHLVADARDAVARLEQIRAILPNPMLLLQPLQNREALRSSTLEGTYATPAELLLFEVEREAGELKPAGNDQDSDRREVWNYCESLRQGNNWLQEGRPLDKSLILRLHRVLMTGVRGKDKHPGEWRQCQVYIGGSGRFIPPPPECIDDCLSLLIAYMANPNDDLEPLVRAFVVHYQFEAIHPFTDGNGRVGRVLLALCVSDWLKLTLPWLYMSEFYERNRDDYLQRLFRVSSNGEWDEWIEYCLEGAIEQARSSLARCNALIQKREEFRTKITDHGQRLHDITESLFAFPVVRTVDLPRKYSITYETARCDVRKLLDVGILKAIADSRPKAYVAAELMEIAYGEPSVE